MKKYTHSVIALFICMLILTPSTVYAEELIDMPVFSVIQPITGIAPTDEDTPAIPTEPIIQPTADIAFTGKNIPAIPAEPIIQPTADIALADENIPAIPAKPIIQPITGTALKDENINGSLTERLNLYLVNSFTNGTIDERKFNQIVASGMISENAFFANSVFVGDSITVGFQEWCRTHESVASDSTYFLARVSCSAKVALSSKALTSYSGVMPKYNGNVQYIEDSISQMPNVQKMFICFGINDLTGSSPSQFVSDMQTLIARITAKTPGLQVYILSIPCIMSRVDSGYLNNASIQKANILLQQICEVNGWGFVNITEHLMGENNAILPEYSSDKYVHQNSRAYKIWNSVLKDYAFMEITK